MSVRQRNVSHGVKECLQTGSFVTVQGGRVYICMWLGMNNNQACSQSCPVLTLYPLLFLLKMISAFFKPQRPFRRLRSLHLSTSQSYTNSVPGAHLETCATGSRGVPSIQTPLRGVVIVRLALIVSLVFISTICFCFIGANTEEEYYKKALTKIADTEPGV